MNKLEDFLSNEEQKTFGKLLARALGFAMSIDSPELKLGLTMGINGIDVDFEVVIAVTSAKIDGVESLFVGGVQ